MVNSCRIVRNADERSSFTINLCALSYGLRLPARLTLPFDFDDVDAINFKCDAILLDRNRWPKMISIEHKTSGPHRAHRLQLFHFLLFYALLMRADPLECKWTIFFLHSQTHLIYSANAWIAQRITRIVCALCVCVCTSARTRCMTFPFVLN